MIQLPIELRNRIDQLPDGIRDLFSAIVDFCEGQLAIRDKKIEVLESRIKELESQVKKDSRTSNKPPSSDGFKKPPASLRERSGKKQGAQKDHPGHTLKIEERADDVIEIRLSGQCNCGQSLSEAAHVEWLKRQVHDIEIRRIVTDHMVEVGKCSCGQTWEAPCAYQSPVQYGVGIRSLLVYFREQQYLSFDRLQETFRDVFKMGIADGTTSRALQNCYDLLEGHEQKAKKGIEQSPVQHNDESGFRVDGSSNWLNVASTSNLTCYFEHQNRGRQASKHKELWSDTQVKASMTVMPLITRSRNANMATVDSIYCVT
jgi:transposase